jgi:hypothetical protein
MIAPNLIQDPRIKRIRSKHGSLCANFFELLGEPASGSVTFVKTMLEGLALRHPGIARIKVVKIMQDLQRAGFGRFIPGRGTKRSRFEWSGALPGRPAAAQAPTVNVAAPAPAYSHQVRASLAGSVPSDTHRIIFRLRKDYTLDLELPSDLTNDEAQRLSKFILALPAPHAT